MNVDLNFDAMRLASSNDKPPPRADVIRHPLHYAVVTDERIRHRDDLAGVRRGRSGSLISGYRGVKDDLANDSPSAPK